MSWSKAGACIAILALCAGCGTAQTASSSSGGASSSASASAPASPAAPVTCGAVTTRGPRSIPGPASDSATNCFLAAFTACAPATLTITQGSIDTVTVHRLSIDAGCHVTDQATLGMVGAHFSPPPGQVVTCSGVRDDGSGGMVITGCGSEGDIIVPAPSPTP